jgi:hypothetical protein
MMALVGFLAGTIGVPLPQLARPTKDRSQPYPCMDHACGCASAEQCWRSCCCFTNREKLAWAAEHGVAAPAYVFTAATRERPKLAGSCCAVKQTVAACSDHKSTCCDHDAHAKDRHGEGAAHASGSVITFVLAIQARKCQGQAELWLALGAATPPPAKFAIIQESLATGDATVVIASLAGISERPATPPPRA